MLKNHINDFPTIFGGQKFKILCFIEIRLFHISLIRLISRGDHFGYSGNWELVYNEIPKDSDTRNDDEQWLLTRFPDYACDYF